LTIFNRFFTHLLYVPIPDFDEVMPY